MPAVNVSTSTISFPSAALGEHPGPASPTTRYPILPNILSSESSFARTSRSSLLRASALEVHDLIWLSESSGNVAGRLNRLYESNAVYKNTFITATSLPVIRDIHALTHLLCDVQLPGPTALITRFLGYEPSADSHWAVWKMWSEIENVCETESFDGHRKSIIEHTIHFLFLGGLVHRSLRVLTTLAFNEQGRITRHEDLCDLRDMLYLIPGGHAVQSLTTRFTAIGLAGVSRLSAAVARSAESVGLSPDSDRRKMSASPGNAGTSHSQQYSHAPDTDSV